MSCHLPNTLSDYESLIQDWLAPSHGCFSGLPEAVQNLTPHALKGLPSLPHTRRASLLGRHEIPKSRGEGENEPKELIFFFGLDLNIPRRIATSEPLRALITG